MDELSILLIQDPAAMLTTIAPLPHRSLLAARLLKAAWTRADFRAYVYTLQRPQGMGADWRHCFKKAGIPFKVVSMACIFILGGPYERP